MVEERLDMEFKRALSNSIRHSKRSLLDFVDLQMAVAGDKADEAWFSLVKRRIHNDLSIIQDQVMASYEILKSGGIIPPFGRTDEQILEAEAAKSNRSQKSKR